MRACYSLPIIGLLSSCSISGDKVPLYPDYCKDVERKFSNSEKIHASIEYVLEKKGNYSKPGADRISHLQRYYGKFPSGTYREIAKKYYGEFPECCRVIKPPSYVKWYKAMSGVGLSEQEIIGKPGEWVADVLIIDLARPKESQRLQQSQFRVGGCNQISLINRG